MSVRVMHEVFTRYPVGEGEMLLALALADHSDDNGEHIWPSVPSLATKTRQTERAVQYQLKKMQERGWLIKVTNKRVGRGQTNEYRISPEWLKGENISPFTDGKRVKQEAERVKSEAQKGEICDIAYKEEPSRTIIEPSSARTKKSKDEILLPDWLHSDDWQAYVDHRKAIKSKLTLQAAKLAIAALDKLRNQGHSPRAVIEQSVLNGWTGLFPLRGNAGSPTRGGNAHMSESELLRLGDELGIDPRPGESMRDFAARVQSARQGMH